MSWRLRVEEQQLQQDLSQLATAGLVELKSINPFEDRWIVSNYERRQERQYSQHPDAVRKREYRARKKVEADRKEKERQDKDKERDKGMSQGHVPKVSHPVWKLPDPLNTDAFTEIWVKWYRHLTEKYDGLGQTQGEIQLERLAEMGEKRAIRALKHTVDRGWKGLREPDKDHGRNFNGPAGDAALQWASVEREIERVTARGKPELPPETMKAIERMGGWSKVCYMRLRDSKSLFQRTMKEVSYG
jgi:hypothetical protein